MGVWEFVNAIFEPYFAYFNWIERKVVTPSIVLRQQTSVEYYISHKNFLHIFISLTIIETIYVCIQWSVCEDS